MKIKVRIGELVLPSHIDERGFKSDLEHTLARRLDQDGTSPKTGPDQRDEGPSGLIADSVRSACSRYTIRRAAKSKHEELG